VPESRRILTALAATVLLLPSLTGCGSNREAPVRGPRSAPDFSLTALDGASYRLSDLRGRPVVLNFWASWCPACSQLAPRLEQLGQSHAEQGLFVVSVSRDEPAEALARKAESLSITYPIALSDETVAAYRVRVIPMTFFIDREGVLVESIMGAADESALADAVRKIL
jgi:thiol-disulfide isomerase/thioredoxin